MAVGRVFGSGCGGSCGFLVMLVAVAKMLTVIQIELMK